jgi:hypothetical protein
MSFAVIGGALLDVVLKENLKGKKRPRTKLNKRKKIDKEPSKPNSFFKKTAETPQHISTADFSNGYYIYFLAVALLRTYSLVIK